MIILHITNKSNKVVIFKSLLNASLLKVAAPCFRFILFYKCTLYNLSSLNFSSYVKRYFNLMRKQKKYNLKSLKKRKKTLALFLRLTQHFFLIVRSI
jgi:hypothetical protein